MVVWGRAAGCFLSFNTEDALYFPVGILAGCCSPRRRLVILSTAVIDSTLLAVMEKSLQAACCCILPNISTRKTSHNSTIDQSAILHLRDVSQLYSQE